MLNKKWIAIIAAILICAPLAYLALFQKRAVFNWIYHSPVSFFSKIARSPAAAKFFGMPAPDMRDSQKLDSRPRLSPSETGPRGNDETGKTDGSGTPDEKSKQIQKEQERIARSIAEQQALWQQAHQTSVQSISNVQRTLKTIEDINQINRLNQQLQRQQQTQPVPRQPK